MTVDKRKNVKYISVLSALRLKPNHLFKRIIKGECVVMKSTGIVRKVDELGRIVIPIELRRTMGIEEKDSLEIYIDEEKIILKKYEPACIFCGSTEGTINFNGRLICKSCFRIRSPES